MSNPSLLEPKRSEDFLHATMAALTLGALLFMGFIVLVSRDLEAERAALLDAVTLAGYEPVSLGGPAAGPHRLELAGGALCLVPRAALETADLTRITCTTPGGTRVRLDQLP